VSVGFVAAVLRGAAETVAVLVDLGANPNPTPNRQPLHDAAFAGKARTVEALLKGGANPDAYDQLVGPNGGATPLLAAITAGSTECVRLLLEHGANPNLAAKFGETPLHAALGKKTAPNRTQLVRMLLERGADVRKPGVDGRTPFDMATTDGDPVITKLFAGR
jgi:ankyrin repeat protein